MQRQLEMTLFLNADIFRLKNRNMDDMLGNKTNAKLFNFRPSAE